MAKSQRRLTSGPHPWALLVALAMLAGCAGTQAVATRDPETRLRERNAQYWDARVRGDLFDAYRFHPPAFREAVTFSAYSQGRGVTTVLDYEIKDVRIDGDEATVKSRYYYTVLHPMLVKPVQPRWGEVDEQWVRVDGEWYRKFRFPVGDPYPDTPWNRPGQVAKPAAPPSSVEAPAAPGR